jgi:hypothetical protein
MAAPEHQRGLEILELAGVALAVGSGMMVAVQPVGWTLVTSRPSSRARMA